MEKYLNKCLSSLILSDDIIRFLDVLIVNDGSKDQSSDIAHSYQKKYPGVFRVIDKDNGNYGSCVNVGLREAKGKYIKILDADDSFDTSHFGEFVLFLNNTDVDVVFNDMCQECENGEVIKQVSFNLPSGIFPLSEVVKNSGRMWMHCVTYKTHNLRDFGYVQTEGISYTDQEWVFLPLALSKSAAYFNKLIYRYLVGREGQTINPQVWNKNFWQELKGLRVMYDEYTKYSSHFDAYQQQYLKNRLIDRTTVCYKAYLLTFDNNDNYQLMVDFDRELKTLAPNIYSRMDDLHYTGYHYVKAWRKKYSKNLFFLKLLKKLRGYS